LVPSAEAYTFLRAWRVPRLVAGVELGTQSLPVALFHAVGRVTTPASAKDALEKATITVRRPNGVTSEVAIAVFKGRAKRREQFAKGR